MALDITRALLVTGIYRILLKGFVESGTATSGTSTTLTDTSKSMTINAHIGRCLQIHTGYGEGALAWVSSNTATAFTVEAFYLPDFQGGVTKITPNSTSQYGLLGTDADIYAASVAGGWGEVTKIGDTIHFNDCVYIGNATDKTGIAFTSNVQFGAYGTPRAFASAANTAVVLGRRTKTESTRNGVQLLQYCTRADSSAGANFGAQWDDLAGTCYFYGSTIKTKKHESDTAISKYAVFQIPYIFDALQSTFDSDGLGLFGTILGAFTRCNITNGQGIAYPFWLYSPNIKFNDVLIYASNQGLRIAYNYNGLLRNCNLIDNTYPVHLYGSVNDSSKFSGLLRLINTEIDLATILVDPYVTGTVQKEYEWSININDGPNNISGAKVYVTDSTGTEVVNTSTDASGNITMQEVIVQKRIGYAGSLLTKTPHTFSFRKYGYFPEGGTKPLSAKTADGAKLRVNPYIVASYETAAAMTGITISALATSLSSAHTLQDIYDRGEYLFEQSNIVEPWTTSDGVMFVQSAGRVFTPWSYLTYGSQSISGGTIAFGTPGIIPGSFGSITARFTAAGTYDLRTASISGTITLTNTSGSPVTVQLLPGVSFVNSDPVTITVEASMAISIGNATLLAGTSVRLFNETQDAELALVLNIPSVGYSYSASFGTGEEVENGDVIRIDALKSSGSTHYKYYSEKAPATPSGISFIGTQSLWTEANALGYDGSVQTEYSLDGVNIQFDVDSPDYLFYTAAAISWAIWATANTEIGMREFFGALTSINAANWKINTSIVDAWLDNVRPYTITQGDSVVLMRDDNVYPQISPTSGGGGIGMIQSGLVFVTETGVSGLTTAESAKLMALPSNTLLTNDARLDLLNHLDADVSSAGGASLVEIEGSAVLAKEETAAKALTVPQFLALK